MEILKGVNLGFAYDYTLFENVNLSVNAGGSCAITGVSGCGKSTILHILSTLLRPKNGEVIYGGKSLYDLSANELLRIRRFDFGIIFQAHYLFKGFSAHENIELTSVLSAQKIDDERVLCKKPRVIFADEPTGNLDKQTANEVMQTLFNYIKANDAALVLVTHDNELAQRCDEVYRLEDQKFSLISPEDI